jgi:hypothetical protein
MHNGDTISATSYGIYMHVYGLEANFKMTTHDILLLIPLEVR